MHTSVCGSAVRKQRLPATITPLCPQAGSRAFQTMFLPDAPSHSIGGSAPGNTLEPSPRRPTGRAGDGKKLSAPKGAELLFFCSRPPAGPSPRMQAIMVPASILILSALTPRLTISRQPRRGLRALPLRPVAAIVNVPVDQPIVRAADADDAAYRPSSPAPPAAAAARPRQENAPTGMGWRAMPGPSHSMRKTLASVLYALNSAAKGCRTARAPGREPDPSSLPGSRREGASSTYLYSSSPRIAQHARPDHLLPGSPGGPASAASPRRKAHR